jgi:uncharacterized protein YyaL (SSP411 family)
MITKHSNRLINSTSPYLLQHAHNPVDWFEWSEEALLKAKKENKPILVSIGYSSCHWCHVMEREAFENEALAAKMNEYLVCIKVDREERPDVDQVYMDAVQAMGIHGGWPLNVFLTPDQKPFYGGTYFPPQQWTQVLNGVNKAFNERRSEVEESAQQFAEHLSQQDVSRFIKPASDTIDLHTDLQEIFSKLETAFDTTWGGIDKEPKFVMPSIWLWLLRYYHISKDEKVLKQIKLTLNKVAMGGIYDQIGGGFARYSVDGYWFAPHFEKMLYDNAQLLSLYAEAFQLTRDEQFNTILDETFEWLQTEMMHPEGGFFSALDADSEGVEGKFYSWTRSELENLLGDKLPLVESYYSLKQEGNWEHGRNILFRSQSDETFFQKNNIEKEQWQRELREIKDTLLEERDKRIPPGLDDKIIAGWNCMTVAGLLDCYKATNDQKYLKAGLKTMEFIEREMVESTTLYRSFKGKHSNTHAFLDDYAYLILAYLKLYQNTFNEYWLKRAEQFMAHVIDHFLDSGDGYFLFSGKYGEKLIANKKEIFDNVIPASNSVMAQNLFQLGTLLDREEWKTMAEKMVMSLAHIIKSDPNYMSNWAIAFTEIRKGLAEVAFIGPDAKVLKEQFNKEYQPFALTMGTATESELPLLKGKTLLNNESAIYVCYNKACQRPVTNAKEALEQII